MFLDSLAYTMAQKVPKATTIVVLTSIVSLLSGITVLLFLLSGIRKVYIFLSSFLVIVGIASLVLFI